MSRGEKISKSHLSGVIVLIFIVLFIQGVLFLFRGKDKICKEAVKEVVKGKPKSSYDTPVNNQKAVFRERKAEIPYEGELEKFDPNTIDKKGLEKLGLSSKQAQVVINYRTKGGKFKKPEDFSKIYVISSKTYEKLRNFIVIKNDQEVRVIEDIVPTEDRAGKYSSEIDLYKEKPLLSLNSADSTDLVSLPGIGPFYARKIIQYRERLGGFAIKEQLLEIYGIDRERFNLFEHRIDVDTNEVSKSDIMESTFEELSRNPYIGGYVARSIIRYREKSGKELINLANLVMNDIIKKELYKILKYYFK